MPRSIASRRAAVERARTWAQQHPERVREIKQLSHWTLRIRVLVAYAGPTGIVCSRCSFDDIRALQLDHIDGGGAQQARQLKGRGWVLYRWLERNGFPPGYQILCANCNWIKRHENEEWGFKRCVSSTPEQPETATIPNPT